MIFIRTDILNPYQRDIITTESYNTLIDFLVMHYPDGFGRPTDVSVNGNVIKIEDFDISLKNDDVVVLIDRTALPVGLIGGWFVTALANLAISVTLSYVANKLFAPDTPDTPQAQSSVYNINSAQNAARYGSPIPIIYGTVRSYPSMIVQPYYKFENNVEYLYHVLCVGQGTLTTDELLIGEDTITTAGDFQWKLLYNDSFYNIPANAYGIHITNTLEVPSNMELKALNRESEKYRISADAKKVEFDYMYPNGIFYVKGDGEYVSTSSSFTIRIYTASGTTYTEVYSKIITNAAMTVDAIQRTYAVDVSSYNEDVYISFSHSDFYDHPRDTHNLYIKRVKEIYPNEDFTNLYGDVTLVAAKIKATDTISSQGQVKINGYFERTDVGNKMHEVLTDIYTNTTYGGALNSSDLSFPITTETVNCAYDQSITIFDAMRKPAIAQGYSLYLAGMDVILKKDEANTVTTAMFNELNILRNSFKAQYIFKEEYPSYDGFECTYIDGDGWIPKSVKYPSNSTRPQRVELFGVVDYSHLGVFPTGANLTLLDTYNTGTFNGVSDVKVINNVAYVVSLYSDYITSIDISDPSNMVVLDSYVSASLNGASGIAVVGNVAYVASYIADSLTTIDITDPSNMTELDTVSSTNLNGAYRVEVSGGVAYVVSKTANTITSIDVSDPSNISILDAYTSANTSDPYGIDIYSGVAYVAAYTSGALTAIDITNPSSMTELDSYSSANTAGAYAVTINGGTAYVGTFSNNTITAIDISTPSAMTEISHLTDGSFASIYGMESTGDIILVVSNSLSTLSSVNVSNPASMTKVDTYTSSNISSPFAVDSSGLVAYVVSSGNNRISSIDIT